MSTLSLSPTFQSPSVRTRPPARPQAPQGHVRLTRRGRLVVFLGSLFLVLALGVVWGAASVAGEQPGTPESTRTVVVGYGDTLWDIADEAATDGDTGAMVERIERLNALDSGMLVAGQQIRVPLDGSAD
jgi:hypothetical protein